MNCPVCGSAMKKYGDQWKCINISAHDRLKGLGTKNTGRRTGKRYPKKGDSQ